MTPAKLAREFRAAVREAIARSHAAGLPVFQGRGGWLVALYPDGRRVKLQRLPDPVSVPRMNGRANADAARRPERGR